MSEPVNAAAAKSATTLMQRRWAGPLLIGSLAFNLFIIGLISGPLLFGHRFHQRHDDTRAFTEHLPPPPDRLLRRGLAALDPRDRIAMRKMVLDAFPAIRPRIKEMEKAKGELVAAIGADPYDGARIKAAFDKMDQAMLETGRAARESMLKGLEKMPAEQRKRMAQAMSQLPGPSMVRKPLPGPAGQVPQDRLKVAPVGSPSPIVKPLDTIPVE